MRNNDVADDKVNSCCCYMDFDYSLSSFAAVALPFERWLVEPCC